MKRVAQLELPLKTWGGARRGAGRKPKGEKARVSHRARPVVTRHSPAHVTLRLAEGLPNLRRGEYPAVVKGAIARSWAGVAEAFRVVHFSVQSNHLHLIVEAESQAALAKGMQGLATRVARAVNRLRGSAGKVFADRYHAHVLRSPREVRNTLLYVLNNGRKHGSMGDERSVFDAHSSAEAFDGWRDHHPVGEPSVTAPARSWLLARGWRRYGLLDPYAVPRRCTKWASGRAPSGGRTAAPRATGCAAASVPMRHR